jgi:hypothetical protein
MIGDVNRENSGNVFELSNLFELETGYYCNLEEKIPIWFKEY